VTDPPTEPASAAQPPTEQQRNSWVGCRGAPVRGTIDVGEPPEHRREGTGMERGSDKHGPRQDENLKAELEGMLGSAGGHREEWVDPEPPADDDPPRPDVADSPEAADPELRMARLQHDLDVANDCRHAIRAEPGAPEFDG
jgi:hypothetical protein